MPKPTRAEKTAKSELKASIERLNSEGFLDEPHPAIFAKSTIFATALALLAFWAWASLTPVYEIVTASGTVKPDGFVIPVEHPDGGTVNSIHVNEGQTVSAGDLILELDASELRAEIEKNRARAQYLTQMIQHHQQVLNHDFSAPITDATAMIGKTSPHLEYRMAQVAHARAARLVARAQVTSMRQKQNKIQTELSILTRRSNRVKALSDQGRIPHSDFEVALIEQLRLEEKFASLRGEIETQLASIDQSLAQERELIASFRSDAATRLSDVKAELTAIRKTTQQLMTRQKSTSVRAQGSGVIGALSVRHAQEVLAPGAVIAEIVPQSQALFAEVEVSAGKIGGVRNGAEARLKILTHDYTRFGHVDARVTSISPNSIVKDDGNIVFTVRLEFDRHAFNPQKNLASDQMGRGIDPGMTVTADIQIGQKTVLAYLVKPLRAISDRAFSEG